MAGARGFFRFSNPSPSPSLLVITLVATFCFRLSVTSYVFLFPFSVRPKRHSVTLRHTVTPMSLRHSSSHHHPVTPRHSCVTLHHTDILLPASHQHPASHLRHTASLRHTALLLRVTLSHPAITPRHCATPRHTITPCHTYVTPSPGFVSEHLRHSSLLASLRHSLRHSATIILRHSPPPQSSPNPTLVGRVRPGM